MANKRMFSLDIVNTDKFLEMPLSSQCLYFHLGMRADDDGFISSPKQIMRMINCTQDDMRILVTKEYVIPFESGVIVIADWKVNNYLRKDRHTPTIYQKELQQLCCSDKSYDMDTNGIPTVDHLATQYSIDKNSIDKISIDKESINTICAELGEPVQSTGITLPLVDGTFYEVPKDKYSMWEETFPGVDVFAEFKKMYMWLESNPKKKKTRRGIGRFIYGWLERSQNSGKSGMKQNNGCMDDVKGWVESNE